MAGTLVTSNSTEEATAVTEKEISVALAAGSLLSDSGAQAARNR
ncbi:hypothetical protein P0082_03885 [Candidatus Haliotispira prima]|uniref:Uncharacterized protein n=1 Tax=Candidatus Haliotispira prima TaxID=3034016 RepID=A0ABY8MJ57_9SPIO|nr:hypothetical protein P0082_03885 [Candidatus Haliotispira prima]